MRPAEAAACGPVLHAPILRAPGLRAPTLHTNLVVRKNAGESRAFRRHCAPERRPNFGLNASPAPDAPVP